MSLQTALLIAAMFGIPESALLGIERESRVEIKKARPWQEVCH